MGTGNSVISVCSWNCNYGSRDLLCDPLHQELGAGGIYQLQGPIACGKSSLLKALAGILPSRYQAGTIQYVADGTATPIAHPLKSALTARAIGYLPQNVEAALLFSKVSDEFLFALEGAPGDAPIELSEVDERLKGFSIARLVSRDTGVLSRGEKQAVALAACVLKQPSVLLLDEPFSALDCVLREQIAQLIRQMQATLPHLLVVIASHQPLPAALSQAIPLNVNWNVCRGEANQLPTSVAPGQPCNRHSTECALEIENLRVEIGSSMQLSIPELRVEAGEVVALRGTTGAGKSTLGLALAGVRGGRMKDVTIDGTVRFKGRSVDAAVRCPTYVSMAFQDPELRFLASPARKDLLKGVRTQGGDVGLILDHSVRSSFDNLLRLLTPDDLERRLDDLSYAQQKAVGLAVLGTCSPMIVIDDPPSSVLSEDVAMFRDWVWALASCHIGVLLLVHDDTAWTSVAKRQYTISSSGTVS